MCVCVRGRASFRMRLAASLRCRPEKYYVYENKSVHLHALEVHKMQTM
uniref:Uncharacterized protein n=1 Tax=Anopheles minimus TaxID=112268 RepID=A0A182WMV8_9DIPT